MPISKRKLSLGAASYRVEGYYRDARVGLQAAMTKAGQSGNQALIAASSGALGNLAFMSRGTAVAQQLLNSDAGLLP
jgi:hypothetical protein